MRGGATGHFPPQVWDLQRRLPSANLGHMHLGHMHPVTCLVLLEAEGPGGALVPGSRITDIRYRSHASIGPLPPTPTGALVSVSASSADGTFRVCLFASEDELRASAEAAAASDAGVDVGGLGVEDVLRGVEEASDELQMASAPL